MSTPQAESAKFYRDLYNDLPQEDLTGVFPPFDVRAADRMVTALHTLENLTEQVRVASRWVKIAAQCVAYRNRCQGDGLAQPQKFATPDGTMKSELEWLKVHQLAMDIADAVDPPQRKKLPQTQPWDYKRWQREFDAQARRAKRKARWRGEPTPAPLKGFVVGTRECNSELVDEIAAARDLSTLDRTALEAALDESNLPKILATNSRAVKAAIERFKVETGELLGFSSETSPLEILACMTDSTHPASLPYLYSALSEGRSKVDDQVTRRGAIALGRRAGLAEPESITDWKRARNVTAEVVAPDAPVGPRSALADELGRCLLAAEIVYGSVVEAKSIEPDDLRQAVAETPELSGPVSTLLARSRSFSCESPDLQSAPLE